MEKTKGKGCIKRIYITIGLLIACFVCLQFFYQPIEAKSITREIQAPKEVLAILERSCYSCHSNDQDLHWYDKLAPLSWVVNRDVTRAREVMNFSEWNDSPADHKGNMYAILNMMQAGKMPLPSYRLLHPSAKVTEKDIAVVKKYTLSLSENDQVEKVADLNMGSVNSVAPVNPLTTPAHNLTAISKTAIPANFPVSPNGVKYTDAFKNWKVISMSTLFDNSIRVIYGNDIAVKTIETEKFHPWPDGSIVVKTVWKQVENENGDIRAGQFVNAQFMVKDAQQYKETEGWGFAKFSGEKLVPTGKNAHFAKQSCISCHRQLAEPTGYLFDVPMKVNPKFLTSKLNLQ